MQTTTIIIWILLAAAITISIPTIFSPFISEPSLKQYIESSLLKYLHKVLAHASILSPNSS